MRNTYRPYRNNFKKKFSPKKWDTELVKMIREAQTAVETITTEKEEVYVPQHSFVDFPIAEELKKNILDKKYTTPTPIQDQTIPAILSGKDVIGVANTGTGKTASFLIPLIDKVLKNRHEKVFILAPTRELALQINEELYSFTKGMHIKSVLCIGGTSMFVQKRDLRRNPHFVIGTPGRIKDLIQRKEFDMSQFSVVVLDEADRMVDIGFIEDIKYFISLLPEKRQSLFFSATVSGKVKEIIQAFVHDPVTISVKQRETASNVYQDIVKVIDNKKKIEQLHDLLIQEGFEKVIIFGRTKFGIQKLANELLNRGFKVGAIHGNKRQNQRQKILDQFKKNYINILLATDVASRGLDIQGITHVINYDMPATYDDYVHRIGRTGRANQKGVALTFVG